MKIDFVSDLHMEINGNSHIDAKPIDQDGDILLLVGDIFCYRHLDPRKTDNEARSFRKRFMNFLDNQPHREIFLVPGNHEYYGFYWHDADLWANEKLHTLDPRVRILQNEGVIRDQVAIFGSTFWTDMNNYNLLTMMAVNEGMNDFRVIKLHEGGSALFSASAAYTANLTSFDRLMNFYEMFNDYPMIIATHHGPSMQSHNSQRFGDTEIKYGYLSEYGDWIAESKIDYWIHGHTHHNVDYRIGNTKIKSAMYGYLGWDRRQSKMNFGRIEI